MNDKSIISKHMIITICNDGSADEVMKIAKENGAGGGTIIRARGSANLDALHFFGITIQPEKELVLIVVTDNEKNKIMQSINTNLGIGTKAHALSISVPIDEVVGINLDNKAL